MNVNGDKVDGIVYLNMDTGELSLNSELISRREINCLKTLNVFVQLIAVTGVKKS